MDRFDAPAGTQNAHRILASFSDAARRHHHGNPVALDYLARPRPELVPAVERFLA